MGEQQDFDSQSISIRLGADNQWSKLKRIIPWESFRRLLKVIDRTNGGQGGRPRYDVVKMFKVVLLGQWHNLSDNDLEQALRVRLDFLVFCGFTLQGDVPDSTTIQDFRTKMIEHDLLDRCLKELNKRLEAANLKIKSGSLVVDSTVIESASRPRNTIVPGEGDEPPSKTTSSDPDSQWTKKGKNYHYGYKEHAVVDAQEGYIEVVKVTGAGKHDGKMLQSVLKGLRGIKDVLADKAYASKSNRRYLKARKIKDSILRKAARNNPLKESDLRHNRRISTRRFVVEQHFGTKKRKFQYSRTRYVTTVRVQAQSYLKAICFNLLKALRMLSPPFPTTA